MRARAALEGGKRHEIDGRVLKLAESNSMSSVANCSERRSCSAGKLGGGMTGTTTKSLQQEETAGAREECIRGVSNNIYIIDINALISLQN